MLVSTQYNRHTGLGNKLFPWSRAKVFSKETGCDMLQQIWFSPRAAAITRGGIDYNKALKKIWLYSNFKSDLNEISLYKYLFLKRQLKKLQVANLQEANSIPRYSDLHLQFKWNTSHDFLDLQGHQEFIQESLTKLVPSTAFSIINKYSGTEFIGLNIRAGNDFVDAGSQQNGYKKTSLEWFIRNLNSIRELYGDLPAVIVSDGGYKQLHPLMRLRKVTLLNSPTAITDLLILANAKVLLGSGNSTFSAWASFLGQMDTFSSKATPFTSFGINESQKKQKVEVL